MQTTLKSSILRHIRLRPCFTNWSFSESPTATVLHKFTTRLCTSKSNTHDHTMTRVIALVANFSNTDAAKVTETASFQKDLCLDSLERVELVMALEQEFSIEIPEEEADKLTCCADVANYISALTKQSAAKDSQ